jgi:hypothetical protein
MLRAPYPAQGQLAASPTQIHAWGSTTGGGTPVLDSPSFGTASITDIATGILDVTMREGISPANYAVFMTPISSTATIFVGSVSGSTAQTATVFRLTCHEPVSLALTDPTVGYGWMVCNP